MSDEYRPLADRLRPTSLADVLGQPKILGHEGTLSTILKGKHLPSLLFWGPPGTGKTTIARLIAEQKQLYFVALSAVFSGVAEMRKEFKAAKERKALGEHTLLFVDEIHRFNRAQQDALLPVIEDGTLTFVAATTENPGFAINNALLSRLQVLTLESLDDDTLANLLTKVEKSHKPLNIKPEARDQLIAQADGDGRQLLNMAEIILQRDETLSPMDSPSLIQWLGSNLLRYDKSQDEHYNLISALHKSLRGSHTDAALYWLARMLAGGEEGNYIARRLLRFAYEDIGLAEPSIASEVLSAWQTYEKLGSPEGDLALAHAVIRLASAPKSNASYVAMKNAQNLARTQGSLPPPKNLINAANSFMKSEGYSEGYTYEHDVEDQISGQQFFPDKIHEKTILYHPVDRGFEREIKKRLVYFRKVRDSRKK